MRHDAGDYIPLEESIGYRFADPALLRQALSHSSYTNEQKEPPDSNERLEFLGDAVLQLVVSHHLFRCCPDCAEGELTKRRAAMVCEPSLAQRARYLGLGDYLLLGKGEEMTGGRTRPSLLADAFEALVGAIYLDGEIGAAEAFIRRELVGVMEAAAPEGRRDYKTFLQEKLQKDPENRLAYAMVEETGPDHAKHFRVQVEVNGAVWGVGDGRSKKEAEQAAAAQALERLTDTD